MAAEGAKPEAADFDVGFCLAPIPWFTGRVFDQLIGQRGSMVLNAEPQENRDCRSVNGTQA